MQKIIFIQTGGTIDKDYPQGLSNHGYAFEIEEPAVIEILQRATPRFQFETVRLMKKDSLDITEEDRQAIVDCVNSQESKQIVITHGTDTIGLTAEALSEVQGKTIVLTGAMKPERFRGSDADFNVGMAVGGAQQLPHGVYIALHGQLLSWDQFVL